MIAKLIEWSLGNRLFVLAGAGLLLLWGAFEALRMPVDVFPDLTAPAVTVVAEAHGMAPEEVETLIAFPLETALNGAPGVRRVRSNSSIGIGVVTVEFDWGADVYQARQIVAERLATVRGQLPPDLPEPTLAPITSIMGEIMFIALHSDRHTPMELKTTADWVLRRRLLAVPGVAEVIPNGGETRQFQVVADPLHPTQPWHEHRPASEDNAAHMPKCVVVDAAAEWQAGAAIAPRPVITELPPPMPSPPPSDRCSRTTPTSNRARIRWMVRTTFSMCRLSAN